MSRRLSWLTERYINFTGLLSYGAPINFLDSTRRRGKTWGIYWRAYKHYKRKHRGTILVRRTAEATKKAKSAAYTSKFCRLKGLEKERFRVNGDFCEYNEGDSDSPRWVRFIKFCTLSAHSAERSSDDDFYDLMILDEGKVSSRERAAYHGDEVMDLMDLYDSMRRESNMQLLIMGNRESVSSPYQSFFGIDPLPIDYEGIRRYRDGTVICAQSVRPADIVDAFDSKVRRALDGTKYGDFAYHGKAKDYDTAHVRRKPKQARYYCSFDFGTPLTAWTHDGNVYFTGSLDASRKIVVDHIGGIYKSVMVYSSSDRSRFGYLINAKRNNAIYYANAAIGEAVTALLSNIGI